jgi:hypothetical protein
MARLRFSFALLTMHVMNRPKGLGLTATLMALCSAFDWTIPNYANIPHPLRVLAINVVLIGIGYVFIWFYWTGKNWPELWRWCSGRKWRANPPDRWD